MYRCIPNDCGEWEPEEEASSGPVMDFEMAYYETEFMCWHKHWKQHSLEPMGVWIMPGKGSTSDKEGVFALGWMYSDNVDGTGIWYVDDEIPSTYTWYVNNAPEQARKFYPAESFEWEGEWGPGLPEPTGNKWLTNDGWYLWEKGFEPEFEDSEEDWADEETIQEWSMDEMDVEEVTDVVEEQQEQIDDLSEAVGDMQW